MASVPIEQACIHTHTGRIFRVTIALKAQRAWSPIRARNTSLGQVQKLSKPAWWTPGSLILPDVQRVGLKGPGRVALSKTLRQVAKEVPPSLVHAKRRIQKTKPRGPCKASCRDSANGSEFFGELHGKQRILFGPRERRAKRRPRLLPLRGQVLHRSLRRAHLGPKGAPKLRRAPQERALAWAFLDESRALRRLATFGKSQRIASDRISWHDLAVTRCQEILALRPTKASIINGLTRRCQPASTSK